uniref:MFS transporter n=1 Tax=Meloidogyne hapla TaxID=6305 RepID=A0A1I8BKY9_MELHA
VPAELAGSARILLATRASFGIIFSFFFQNSSGL